MKHARVAYQGAIHNATEFVGGVRLNDGRVVAESEVTWLSPIVPGTIFAVGLNYADHAKELSFSKPEADPLIFLKGPNTIAGHRIIGERCRSLCVDTIVVLDVHWLVNAGYHVNCFERFKGIYSSNELPHFIKDMHYEYPGNPGLGRAIAARASGRGVPTRAHEIASLELEYGTLVPMRYMNADKAFKVVSVAAWCAWHKLDDSRRLDGRAAGERIPVPPVQRQRQSGRIDVRDQPRVLPPGGPARRGSLEAG